MLHWKTLIRSTALASLAAAIVGAAPGAYAAPVPARTLQPLHSNPFTLPGTLSSGRLNADLTTAFNLGLGFQASQTASTGPQSTPIVTAQNTLLMEAPFEDVDEAWQQANDLGPIVTNSPVWGVSQGVVPAPAINIEVPIGFIDASRSPIFPIPEPADRNWHYQLGGDHAIYTVQVEDCLPVAQAAATGLSQFIDPGTQSPVDCTDPLGNFGFYYVLGRGQTNLYSSTSPKGQQLSQNITGQDCVDARAPSPGAVVRSCVLIPVQLPAIANSLRLDIDLHVVEDPGDPYLAYPWDPYVGGVPFVPAGEILLGPVYPQAETSGSVTLQPVVVLPAALAQLKVMPYTIVYMPPGNASDSSFTTTSTFGTTMTAGGSTAIDNSTKSTKTLDIATTVSASFGLGGADLSTDSHWDHSTSSDVGKVQTDSTTTGSSVKTVRTFGPLTNRGLVPGSKGNYQNEPFWSDEFVLLQHPQLGIWNLNGTPQVQLLGARGVADAPDFAQPSLKDLDYCAKAVGPYATGYTLPDGDVLNAQECLALAKLDPFYGVGQWLDPRTVGRGVPDGGTDYGMDPAGTPQDESATFGQTITWTSVQSPARSTSFDASVTDVFGHSYSAGLTLGATAFDVGVKTNVTVKGGSSTSNTVDMKISYQNSTATTVQSATDIAGHFDDHNTGLGYRPHVNVYRDPLFGAYMFQDPTACGVICGPVGLHVGNTLPNSALSNVTPSGQATIKSATLSPSVNPPRVTP